MHMQVCWSHLNETLCMLQPREVATRDELDISVSTTQQKNKQNLDDLRQQCKARCLFALMSKRWH